MKKITIICLVLLLTHTVLLQAQYMGGNGRGDVSIRLTNVNIFVTINLSLKVLMEGMFWQDYNQMARNDTVSVYLRDVSPPYLIVDSAKCPINRITFFGLFNFANSSSGNYYLVVKHFNCIETWSKAGGEPLVKDGSTYNYDFTNSVAKAYGNNLKQKGTKYCMFSGDVNLSGTIDLADVLQIYNDASNFVSGYVVTDLTGDGQTALDDVLIAYNNSTNFVSVVRP